MSTTSGQDRIPTVAEYVADLVKDAPPLTPEQQDLIRTTLADAPDTPDEQKTA